MTHDLTSDEAAMLEEADAMLEAVESKRTRRPRTYNFRKPRLLSQDQVRLLNHVHTGFARDLSVYLSAQLRSIVDMGLVTVEQVHYSEYVESCSSPSALYVVELADQPHRMVLEFDPRLVLYTVEKLFGGHGAVSSEPREISHIERRVMSRVIERTYRGLETAWQQIHPISLSTSSFETDAEFVQAIPGAEPAVVATFEVAINDHRAVVRICYPYVVIERMLGRTGIRQWLSQPTEPVEPKVRERYEQTLRKAELELRAELGRAHLTIHDILALSVGDVITVDRRINEPVQIVVGSRPQFRAQVGRAGTRTALRIIDVIQSEDSEPNHEESEG